MVTMKEDNDDDDDANARDYDNNCDDDGDAAADDDDSGDDEEDDGDHGNIIFSDDYFLKFGLNVGETVTMPETGDVVTIVGDPSITAPGIGGFLGATEATREVSFDNWLISPLQTALAIFVVTALMFRSISVPFTKHRDSDPTLVIGITM